MSHAQTVDSTKQSTHYNPDSVVNQGEFMPHKPRDEPMEKGGHKPGVKASEADNAPEFHAQTLPAGSAPPERTFEPQALESRARGAGEEILPTGTEGMPGATSADVHTGLGHPGQGQTSQELHHDGRHGRKKQEVGLQKHGRHVEAQAADPRQDERQRALEKEEVGVVKGRGNKGELAAEDLPPASA